MKVLSRLYMVVMALLALVVIGLIAAPEEESWVYDVNLAIWLVFVVDYVVRLALAPDKKRFIRENLIDLLAIIPFEMILANEEFAATRLLRLARLARLIWLLRAGAVLWRMSRHTRGILNTNGVGYVLVVALFLVVMGGIGLWAIEPDIGSPLDGVWWGFVTTTTVGYGDISPKTLGGRVIGVGLMLLGIGCISTLSASIATYFLGHHSSEVSNPHVTYVRQCLGRWDEMAPSERRQLAVLLTALAADEEIQTTPLDGKAQPEDVQQVSV
jgi:voltage-gated potassium channel